MVCDPRHLAAFVTEKEVAAIWPEVERAHKLLYSKEGAGAEFLGWVELPQNYDRAEFTRIAAAAEKIRNDTDVFVVIGIGGSYLGARAAVEAMTSVFYNLLPDKKPQILFVGNNLSGDYLQSVLALCRGKRVSVNVISKSGTTLEPAAAFRLFKNFMEETYGKKEAAKRIYVTTDQQKGSLKPLADAEGYESFVVPDDVGGRYSVLTAVGLLPIAVAGLDIQALLAGAEKARLELSVFSRQNPACLYAALRNLLYRKGKKMEFLACYEPNLRETIEWFKQLFAESEGKEGKGIFPTGALFTTDLHSIGQYIQEGERHLFETVLWVENPKTPLAVPGAEADFDGLSYLAGKPMHWVNQKAMEGTTAAHTAGGVPCIELRIPSLSEADYGYLLYFFELACGISGYMLGINPFDQPGVQAYKANMTALLHQ